MPWLEVRARVSAEVANALGDELSRCGAISIALEDPQRDVGLFEPAAGTMPLWETVVLTALFPLESDLTAVRTGIAPALSLHALEPWQVEFVADADWERKWLERFRPIDFGHGLWVCPSWCVPPIPDATNIVLDPGLAFGTGTHATTGLCLRWLACNARAAQRVLDYGCGSGILAVAALKRGAAHAWAVDIDPLALTVARENAERNGVSAALTPLLPNPMLASLQVDIAIANILAKPLIDLAPLLTRQVNANGTLLLSGLLATQVDEVCAAYPQWTFAVEVQDDWALLIGKRTV